MLFAALTATFLIIDISQATAVKNSPSDWQWLALASFLLFGAMVYWREYERHIAPHPQVQFSRLSPANSTVRQFSPGKQAIYKLGHFLRIAVINNPSNPTGYESTAQQMSAAIRVFASNGAIVDEWNGRWANLDEATAPSSKWELDRIDLPANGQEAVLDIAVRYDGEILIHGWDNSQSTGSKRMVPIVDGVFCIHVTVRAANMKPKQLYFRLTNPNDVQASATLQLVPDQRSVFKDVALD